MRIGKVLNSVVVSLFVAVSFSWSSSAFTGFDELSSPPVRVINVKDVPVGVKKAKLMKSREGDKTFVFMSLANSDEEKELKSVTLLVIEIDSRAKKLLNMMSFKIPYTGDKTIMKQFNLSGSEGSEIVVMTRGYQEKDGSGFELSINEISKLVGFKEKSKKE